jgi:hypothetical protein
VPISVEANAVIDTSVEYLTENIRRLCGGLAGEIRERVVQDVGHYSHGNDIGVHVEHHATQVLIDWFMGNYIPNTNKKPVE